MIPSKTFITIIALWTISALFIAFYPLFAFPWQVAGVVVMFLSLWDLQRLRKIPLPEIQREISSNLAHGETTLVRLYLKTTLRSSTYIQIYDDIPPSFQHASMPVTLSLEPDEINSIEYQLKPLNRGNAVFRFTFIRLHSPLQLWCRQIRIDNESEIKVYPNFSAITKYALLALDNRESVLGIQQKRLRGEGSEFHQLREYRQGDSQRQIDWKASIRLQKMISREYQQDRDQKILFLLDCGRRMTARDGAYSHFDEALNSLLLLGYVALRQGDAVGMQCFGYDNRFLKPIKGMGTIKRLLNFSYDLKAELMAPDYMAAVKNLLVHEKRRSLVIWLTNLRDDDAEELLPAIQLLKKHHLVLIANLKENLLDTLDKTIPDNFQQALSVSAAIGFQQRRQQAFKNLSREGVILIDTTPAELPSALVNAYLEIKASSKL